MHNNSTIVILKDPFKSPKEFYYTVNGFGSGAFSLDNPYMFPTRVGDLGSIK
jgi:hypothetical protein